MTPPEGLLGGPLTMVHPLHPLGCRGISGPDLTTVYGKSFQLLIRWPPNPWRVGNLLSLRLPPYRPDLHRLQINESFVKSDGVKGSDRYYFRITFPFGPRKECPRPVPGSRSFRNVKRKCVLWSLCWEQVFCGGNKNLRLWLFRRRTCDVYF